MKVRLLQHEIFSELINIAMTPNLSGKPFVSSKLYSSQQLNDVKSKLMILIDRMNYKESNRLFPELYQTPRGPERRATLLQPYSPDRRKEQRRKV